MSRVLVVSPHPDDESVGCGGTVRKHVLDGDAVRVVFLSSGEMGIPGLQPEEARRIREAEAEKAAGVLGVEAIEFWGEPDGGLRARPGVVARLRELVEQWAPDRLLVTHEHEMHPDHRAASQIVRRALAPMDGAPAVLEFEVWTPLRDMKEIVDISPYVADKVDAIRCYESQCDRVRLDDALLALNRYRGELHSWPGGDFAEVFWIRPLGRRD